jgi:very-short-patch-repair endonuclease
VPSVSVRLHRLDAFATRHHGLITLPDALRLGVSRSSWYRALDSQHFEQLHPGVARLWGTPATFEQRALAAAWAADPGAMTSHRTSARLWGVERPEDDPIDVITPQRTRGPRPDGVIVHRPRDIADLRPIVRRGVPTTNPMRMLLDLGAVDEACVYDALIAVMSAKVASPAAIRSTLIRHSKKGRHGVTALRTALERWTDEELPPDSELEERMAALVRAHRLPRTVFHAMVQGYEVDFLVAGTRIVIECDGWKTHGLDRDQFEFDRIRNVDLTAAGYVMVHITWRRLTTQPDLVAEQLWKVLREWAPELVAGASG